MAKKQQTENEEENRPQAEEKADETEATASGDAEAAEPDEPGKTDDPAAALESERDELAAKLREAEERYLRQVAEFENYRRRMAREREELRTVALAGLIEDLLPSLDNLKLGLVAADNHPEAKVVSEGFRMVAAQLHETLRGYGLAELSPEGEEFDPNAHDCIAHRPDPEKPENTVVETVRSGFKLRERLIRPASVVVSSGPEEAKPSDETEEPSQSEEPGGSGGEAETPEN